MKKLILLYFFLTSPLVGLMRLKSLFYDTTQSRLAYAIRLGDIAMTIRLLFIIDNVNNPLSFFGPPPLFLAIDHDNAKIIKLLIKAGANKEQRYHGMTPLVYAAYKKNMTLFALFMHLGADTTYFEKDSVEEKFLRLYLKLRSLDHGERCPICYETIKDIASTRLKTLSLTYKCCNNFICEPCKELWAQQRNICPMCTRTRFVDQSCSEGSLVEFMLNM